jgi:hypothetical protein
MHEAVAMLDAWCDLLKVLEDRYGPRSTIVTSQLSHKRWHARRRPDARRCDLRPPHPQRPQARAKGPSKCKPEEPETDK